MSKKKKGNNKKNNSSIEKLKDKDFEVKKEEATVTSKKVEDEDKKEAYYEEIKSIKNNKSSNKNNEIRKNTKHALINLFLLITIIVSLIYFFIVILDKSSPINTVFNSSIICLFSILYLGVCFTYHKKNKKLILYSAILLMIYFLFNINISLNLFKAPIGEVTNLSGLSISEAIKWAEKNKITIAQEYEYSDSVPEYNVIGQSVRAGTNIEGIEKIVLTISEGPNPYKEVIVPSMLTWDSERVINFVLDNYLTNVVVEFVESDKVKDTVIEQSKSGSLLRNDELKITFSYGDEGDPEKAKMLDFTNMSKFEIEFFMKQHHINYEFKYDFSKTVKKGYGMSQDVKHGEEAEVNGRSVTVTISKGPEIKIPKLANMDVGEITDWAVKNKLKLEFNDKYDEKIKAGRVIDTDHEVGDVVEQGSTIKVNLSLGSLKMPEFKEFDTFYAWAEKNEIKYEVTHEYSDSVDAGYIISISHKKGQALKNNAVIKVTVSDGVKRSVPNVVGLTKSQAGTKINNAGLNYTYVYKNSSETKDKVIAQSISAGSEVPDGTTITVTLSSGKAASSSNNNSGGSSQPAQPTCDTSKGETVWFMAGSTGTDTFSMTKNQNQGFNFTVNYVDSCPNGNTSSGTLCSSSVSDGSWVSYCTTINMTIVK